MLKNIKGNIDDSEIELEIGDDINIDPSSHSIRLAKPIRFQRRSIKKR